MNNLNKNLTVWGKVLILMDTEADKVSFLSTRQRFIIIKILLKLSYSLEPVEICCASSKGYLSILLQHFVESRYSANQIILSITTDKNKQNEDGKTALHKAMVNGDTA